MLSCSENEFNFTLKSQNWLEHRVYIKNPKIWKTYFHKTQQIDQLIITQDRWHIIMIKWVNLTSQFHQFKPNWTKTPIRVVSSPRNIKFSQFIKLIKLIHQEQFYIVLQQKPIDQFPKKKLKSSKIPIFLRFENNPKCMTKICFDSLIDRRERERCFEKVLNSEEHVRNKGF